MRVLVWGFACVVVLAQPARSQAFNCNFAKQPDELTICRDDSLKALDEQMADAFFKIRQQLPEDGASRLKAEQKEFMSQRAFCGTDGDCIASAYEQRLKSLCVMASEFSVDCPTTP
jgi:uncharacterized protein